MGVSDPPKRVAIVVPTAVVSFDLAVANDTFRLACFPDGRRCYDVTVCGEGPTQAQGFEVRPEGDLSVVPRADLVVLPGSWDLATRLSARCLGVIHAAAANGARVLSICSGAFLLAQTGLLDGRRATTHWLAAEALASAFPRVTVDPNVLFTEDGPVWTSAGAAAGLDLCIHVVRHDFGAAIAADVARRSVMPLERPGGQAQFIAHALPATEGASLSTLLAWIEANLDRDLDVASLAKRAGMSVRGLSRHFRAQTKMTPSKWVALARVRRSQVLLETTDLPIERIGEAVGMPSPATFRARFRGIVGTSPRAYRSAFRAGG